MRLSRIFQLSFAGSLLFSPAMAQEADQMHQEALRVLHQSMGQTASGQSNAAPISNSSSSASTLARPTPQQEDAVSKARTEREMRLNAEAQKRLEERDKIQEQRRKEFEQYVKDRERLRQQQREYDEKISTQTGALNGTNAPAGGDVHAKALEVLHQTEAKMAPPAQSTPQPALQPSATPAGTSDDELQRKALEILRAKKAETSAAPQTAPAATANEAAAAAGSASTMVAQSNSDAQERALEILHQQMQAPTGNSGTATVAPATAAPSSPQPSPYLQQRLKEIQNETAASQPVQSATSAPSAAQSAPTPVPDSYIQELERTAREAAQQRAAGTAAVTGAPASTAPILDPKLRNMLERQNREISRESGLSPAVTTASQPYYFPRRGLSPEAEAKARQILEQEQGLIPAQPAPASTAAATMPAAPAAPMTSTPPARIATPSVPATTAPPIAATAPTPAAGTIAPDDSQVRYSKELEERARQILLQRAQNQSTAAAQPAPAPAAPVQPAAQAPVTPAAPTAPAQAGGIAAAKAASQAQADEMHARALETLNQIESGKAPQPSATGPMSKQERLRAITDLYKADKMTPAEYHRQRAAIIASPN